jgi:hypothetical protein
LTVKAYSWLSVVICGYLWLSVVILLAVKAYSWLLPSEAVFFIDISMKTWFFFEKKPGFFHQRSGKTGLFWKKYGRKPDFGFFHSRFGFLKPGFYAILGEKTRLFNPNYSVIKAVCIENSRHFMNK